MTRIWFGGPRATTHSQNLYSARTLPSHRRGTVHNNNGNDVKPPPSLFSRQSLLILMVGILTGYVILPVLLIELHIDSSLARFESTYYKMKTMPGGGGGVDGTSPLFPVSSLRSTSSSITTGMSSASSSNHRALVPVVPNLEALSDIEKRLVADRDLLSRQSLPTSTTPYVIFTPHLPDSKRLKILVTGGAGFVGSHLVDKLMGLGHEVIVLDNFFTGQKKNIAHWLHHPNFSLIVHDVIEPITLEVDQIYHLACPASPPHYQYNPVKTIKTSAMGTLNMLGLARRTKARILLASTSEIYGDPQVHPQKESYWGNVNTIGPRACYDEGKRVAETMMYSYRNQNNVTVRVARIFNTFGPRMHPNDGRVVSNFIIQALQNKDMTIYGDGSQTRSFQFVTDLVEGLYSLMNGGYDNPVNLGNPDEYSVQNFAVYIKNMTKSKSKIINLAKSQDDPSQRKPDITTARKEIDWQPKITVEDGLKKTIAYFQSVLDEAGEIIPTGPGASKPEA